jgi:copper chaperone
MKQVHLSIDGMHCGACVKRVSKALETVPGVQIGQVGIGSADLAFNPAETSADAILGAVKKAGYAAQVQE